jgi:hypothetical protein
VLAVWDDIRTFLPKCYAFSIKLSMSAENPFKPKPSFWESINSPLPVPEEILQLAKDIGNEGLIERIQERLSTESVRKAQFSVLAYLDGYLSEGIPAKLSEEQIHSFYDRIGFTAEERSAIRNFVESPFGTTTKSK